MPTVGAFLLVMGLMVLYGPSVSNIRAFVGAIVITFACHLIAGKFD